MEQPDQGLPRRKLLEAMRGRRLVVVSAPAGSGKTTLLRQQAALASDHVWVQLHDYDVSPHRFIDTVTASGSGLIERSDDRWEFDRLRSRFVVIDDVHLLRGSPALELLLDLVRSLPLNWRLSLASRHLDGIEIDSVLEEFDGLHLHWEDLKFGLWETDQLFARHYGLRLRPSEIAPLARNSGGWATALQLFSIAARRQPERRRELIDELRSPGPALRQYLVEQVFGQLETGDTMLLAQLASFERIEMDMVVRHLGSEGSSMVNRLIELGLLTAFDRPGTYQLHPLLRNHLLEQLATEQGYDALAQVHRISANALEAEAKIDAASRAYFRAGRFADAERLEGRGLSSLSMPELRSVMAGDRWGLWAQAVSELRRGNLDEAASFFEASLVQFESGPTDLRRQFAQLTAWLAPPEVPEPARPLGALRRWLDGDDGGRTLLASGQGLASDIYRAVSASIVGGEPRPVDYQGTDQLARLTACLVTSLLQLAMDGDGDGPALREAEILLQTGTSSPSLERIYLGLSAPTSGDGSMVAELLRRDAVEMGDLLGADVLEAIELLRRLEVDRPAALARIGFERLQSLPVADHPAPAGGRSRSPVGNEFFVQLFGHFRIGALSDADQIDELRPQQLAVLEALALRADQWVDRNKLLDWFWPEVDRVTAVRRLATALSAVRKAIELHAPGAEIQRRADSYSLVTTRPIDFAVVVSQLRTIELEARLDLDRALDLLEGALGVAAQPLLPTAESSPWARDARWELEDRWQRAALALFEGIEARGSGGDATPDRLLERLPSLLAMVPGSDLVWRRGLQLAERSNAPLLAQQIEARYHEMVGDQTA